MSDWTPTTAHVRDAYVRQMRDAFVASTGEHEAEFDRWLATVRNESWGEGFETAEESSPYRDNPYDAHRLGAQEDT